VGKRALECLVRVGALDRFGPRPALLQALDRIISVSGTHFRAAELGQMTFFGSHTGLQEDISLPKTTAEISHREQLNWERELIGLYVSDHPLSPVMDYLNEVVTHFSGQLSEANPQEKVRVAGLITRFRTHLTKQGKNMAFATLEDLQGEIDLVIFPRTWTQISSQFEVGKIVIVEGKIDSAGGEPKVLVDSLTTDLKTTAPLSPLPLPVIPLPDPEMEIPDETEPSQSTYAFNSQDSHAEWPSQADSYPQAMVPSTVNYDPSLEPDRIPAAPIAELKTVAEPVASFAWNEDSPEPLDDDLPPPPDIFPPGWDLANAVVAAVADPQGAIELANVDPLPVNTSLTAASSEPSTSAESGVNVLVAQAGIDSTPPPAFDIAEDRASTASSPSQGLPPYLLPPTPVANQEAVQMLTIYLRPSEDKVRDNLRIRQIYGTLIAFPGKDRFAFHVFERGRGYLIEFPNFTTGLCPDLLNRLRAFIPAEQLRIDAITFQ
jgi:DNA polymerase-3 subunit alpha